MRIVTLSRGNTGDRVDTERSGGHSRETHVGSEDAECRP